MTDRAKDLQRAENTQRVARYRARKAGLLPPVPRCSCCGHQARTDRWGGLCALCARVQGVNGRGTPQPLRLAAEAVLRELRRPGGQP